MKYSRFNYTENPQKNQIKFGLRGGGIKKPPNHIVDLCNSLPYVA